MNFRQIWSTVFCVVTFISLTIIEAQNATGQVVKDPMTDLLPIAPATVIPGSTQNNKPQEFDVESEEFDQLLSPTSKKRDVIGNIVTMSEGNRRNMHRFYVEEDQLTRASASGNYIFPHLYMHRRRGSMPVCNFGA